MGLIAGRQGTTGIGAAQARASSGMLPVQDVSKLQALYPDIKPIHEAIVGVFERIQKSRGLS